MWIAVAVITAAFFWSAVAGDAAIMEQLGFDTWLEAWHVTGDTSKQAITDVGQSDQYLASWFNVGAHCLRAECDLRPSPASKQQGRILVDLQDRPAFAIDVPVDLTDTYMRYKLIWPAGGDLSRGTNRYRVFTADASGKYQYYGAAGDPTQWVKVSTGGYYVSAAILVTATNGTEDAGFDPSQIRYFGLDVAINPGSTGVYTGPIYLEEIKFPAPPSVFVAQTNQKFSFDADDEGFEIQTYQDSQAITNCYQAGSGPSNLTGVLVADVHLDENTTNFSKGEVFIDMGSRPPSGVSIPIDLYGKRVNAWVYCPPGLRGPANNPNGIQVFCKDASWKAFYGSTEHVTTSYWLSVSMTPDTNAPNHGYMQPGFDPTQIRVIGVKVAAGGGSGVTYDGPLYLDDVSFDAVQVPMVISNVQYDFEVDENGFEPTDDPGNLAVTSAVQSTEIAAANGSGVLKLGVDLSGADVSRDAGEVFVDMDTYVPFGAKVPMDLEGKEIAIYVYSPTGARGGAPDPNGLQVFVKDSSWKSEYGTWTHVTEGAWQKVTLTPSTNEPPDGYMEPGFDPTSIRVVGIKLGAGNTSSVYAGPIYVDAVAFDPQDEPPFAAPAHEKYSFDDDDEGWECTTDSTSLAATNSYQVSDPPENSTGALAVELDLIGGDAQQSKGEVFVYMDPENHPPFGVIAPIDLEGKTVSAWVYCPAGLRGDPTNPNGFQVFVKDGAAKSFYGSWHKAYEGYWYEITTVPATNAPEGGVMDAGFDPTQIVSVGVKVGVSDGSTATYEGRLYVDGIAFDAQSTPSGITNVQYDFETTDEGFEPSTDPGNLAVTSVVQSTEITAAEGSGVLKMNVDLDGSVDAQDGGEASVDMENFVPYRARYPVDLEGDEIAIYVYSPAGVRGNTHAPNGLRVFVKDEHWKSEYGTWTPVVEGAWQKIVLVPATTAPTNGYMDPGFDPTKIRSIGINYSAGSTSTAYAGPIYIDAVGFPVEMVPVQYDFEVDEEGFAPSDYEFGLAITSAVQTTAMAVEGAGSIRCGVDLDGSLDVKNDGEVLVDMQFYGPAYVDFPFDLEEKPIAVYVYSPTGARGDEDDPNSLRVFVKDENWKSEYGSWTKVREGEWQRISLTPSTNEPPNGFKDADFDPSRIRTLGISFTAGDTSAVYQGPIYVDAVCFDMEQEVMEDLRYGFEPNEQGWIHETWSGLESVTSVAQTAETSIEGAYSLRLDVDIDSGTNESKGASSVDMRWFPPPTVRAPFNLDGKKVAAYVYCPTGSQSDDWTEPNKMKLYVKDSNWKVFYGPYTAIRDGEWVRLSMVPDWTVSPGEGGYMEEGFTPTNIVQVGIEIAMQGTYQGPLYLDHVSFEADPLPGITNAGHAYDYEAECQSRYWTWDTNPDGWNAQAWTNVYLASGEGVGGSTALAADAVFADTNAVWDLRKGVFEIAYNPPLNLATKDHRRVQAQVRFDPPLEGLGDFLASINLFDKNTDQWYWKDFNVGGSSWNIIEFDLDDPDDYAEWSPDGPMDTSAIGFIVIQVMANAPWSGTIYIDEVVVGGTEVSGAYDPPRGGIVEREGHEFLIDQTNFYFAGVNIEYIAIALPLITVEELLDLTTNLHLDVVRAWGFHEGQDFSFQPEQGVWNEMAFENLDRVIAMAGHRNIRLMLGVVDNWGHNGGMFKYMEWVQEQHPESLPEHLRSTNALGSVALHDEFFVNEYAKQWYRDYATELLQRTNSVTGVLYKDDPTIFAWEIVNEPRCETDMEEGRPYGISVNSWIHEMSDFVRGLDAHHMLAAGEEGGYIMPFSNATERGYYQEFHRNYWLYGLRGESNSGAGAMADFLSDYSSANSTVFWQLGTFDNPGDILSEIRPGNSNINFAPFRLYIDDKEYNIWHTNWNGYNQRREWMVEHTRDAHQILNKPVVLEEFGIHAFGWSYQGFFGQYQHVPVPKYYQDDRVEVYREIYSYVEEFNMNGSFFWNLGYTGMWEDPWYTCEAVGDWWYESMWSDATGIDTDTNNVIEGDHSLKLSFDVSKGHGKSIYAIVTNEQWVVRLEGGEATGVNRVKFFWNIYNPGSSCDVAIAVRVWETWGDWHESLPQPITTGWNRVMFDLSAGTWKSGSTGWEYTGFLKEVLEDVRQVVFLMYGDNGAGELYLDDITIRRDDGFIIYADDPVCDVIRDHADVMREKSRRYTVHLAYSLGEDLFPQAQAEHSNYTGAASCWMIARFLNGESFTQTQDEIYGATAHDPLHNNEITPQSCATWMVNNAPAGYFFSARQRTNLTDALKEAVFWMDYIPPAGQKTPVYLLCDTNWSYKVGRGFQADRKPYDGGFGPTNTFTVYGLWLNDPRVTGLGYNVYASAEEMETIFLPSKVGPTSNEFWLVAEPPVDAEAMAEAMQEIGKTTVKLAPPDPNPAVASMLQSKFGSKSRSLRQLDRAKGEGEGPPGGGDLEDVLPDALKRDEGFMGAFYKGGNVSYYQVNPGTAGHYYLAAGGERGPASTLFVLKLATNGALQQATWDGEPRFYPVVPLESAEYAARRQNGWGPEASLVNDELVSSSTAWESPFTPMWELEFDVNGTTVVSTVVAEEVDLSGDGDGDDMSDGAELYAGSDPDDPLSVFSVEGGSMDVVGPDELVIRWSSISNRSYSVYRCTDILQGMTLLESNIAATCPENTYTDVVSSATVYYRIEVE